MKITKTETGYQMDASEDEMECLSALIQEGAYSANEEESKVAKQFEALFDKAAG